MGKREQGHLNQGNESKCNSEEMEHCKVDETAMIRKRCNRMPHHAQDSKRERSTNIKCDTSSEFVSLSIPS